MTPQLFPIILTVPIIPIILRLASPISACVPQRSSSNFFWRLCTLTPHHYSDMQTHGYLMTPHHFLSIPSIPSIPSPCVNRLYRHTAAAIQTQKRLPAHSHTRRTRARALGAKNAKKSQIFAFFCLKSFDKSILDDILCLVLRLLSSGDNKTG